MFRLQGSYLLRHTFPGVFDYNLPILLCESSTPYIKYTVWALASSLATTGAIIHLFSLPLGTKMFQFPRFPSSSYVFTWRYLYPHIGAFPHSDIYGWFRSFAAHRSFSQLVTSFFGAWCQGILRTLFFRLVIRVFLTRLPSGNKKTFVSVLVLLHCKTFTSILFLRTKSFTSFYAYYSFSLFLLSIVSISYSRYTLCSCQCAKLSATLCRLSRPERDSLISIALFIGQVKRFY